jgi:hypothetical protein
MRNRMHATLALELAISLAQHYQDALIKLAAKTYGINVQLLLQVVLILVGIIAMGQPIAVAF